MGFKCKDYFVSGGKTQQRNYYKLQQTLKVFTTESLKS